MSERKKILSSSAQAERNGSANFTLLRFAAVLVININFILLTCTFTACAQCARMIAELHTHICVRVCLACDLITFGSFFVILVWHVHLFLGSVTLLNLSASACCSQTSCMKDSWKVLCCALEHVPIHWEKRYLNLKQIRKCRFHLTAQSVKHLTSNGKVGLSVWAPRSPHTILILVTHVDYKQTSETLQDEWQHQWSRLLLC